eukprot:Phypoly_transcript_03276.p1 GENE.Phypoly_transcript_03276~~Phypoly_transcript_03276.p1  ORF type:complete len:789 (+),score=125.59 Phypoly_transcript_03276:89-2455(+)
MHEQDLPHDHAVLEQWYLNGHLHTDGSDPTNPPFSFYASFAKARPDINKNPCLVLSWAIVDMREGASEDPGRYHSDVVLDGNSRAALELAVVSGDFEMDEMLLDPLRDIMKKGITPGPDRAIRAHGHVSPTPPLAIQLSDEQLARDDVTGAYRLKCKNSEKDMMLDLEFFPQRAPVRTSHKDSTKISIPRMKIKGKMSVLSVDKRLPLPGCVEYGKAVRETHTVSGYGWYEHTFGDSPLMDDDYKYKHLNHWFSLQLSNNTEISILHSIDPTKKEIVESMAVISSDSIVHKEFRDLELKPVGTWMSMQTSLTYPVKWQLSIPSAKVDLLVEPAMEYQELVSFTRNPGTWEGRVHVTGTVDGKSVTGCGFLVMNAALGTPSVHDFFKNFVDEVVRQTEVTLPRNPTYDEMRKIVGVPGHMIKELDVDVIVNSIINPLRDIMDRGGKCWRSYCVLLCIDSVGGNSNPYRKWLIMPEIIQAGSLIQDDIQDRSETRRMGPCCHKAVGEPAAISVFSSAYLIGANDMQFSMPFPTELKLDLLNYYLSAMRSAQVGQAIDVHGFEDLMPEAIEKGDYTRLLARMKSCYTLKTGAAFYFCARMGARVGGGTEEQMNSLSNYFEALATCFQIVDDVLNLRGFAKPHKTRGEDIIDGKVTSPIAMAMDAKLVPSKEARQSIFDRLKSRPNPLPFSKKMAEIKTAIDGLAGRSGCEDELKKLHQEYETNQKLYQEKHDVLYGLIDELEKCGAIEAANQLAVRYMADAWRQLDATLPDTRYKVILKAFGSFMLGGKYT